MGDYPRTRIRKVLNRNIYLGVLVFSISREPTRTAQPSRNGIGVLKNTSGKSSRERLLYFFLFVLGVAFFTGDCITDCEEKVDEKEQINGQRHSGLTLPILGAVIIPAFMGAVAFFATTGDAPAGLDLGAATFFGEAAFFGAVFFGAVFFGAVFFGAVFFTAVAFFGAVFFAAVAFFATTFFTGDTFVTAICNIG